MSIMLRNFYKCNSSVKKSVYYRSCLKYSRKAKPKNQEDPVEINRERALKSFDDLYKKVYGDSWPSMRVALLSPSKKALVVNNFSDLGRIINDLEDKGILSVYNAFELRQKQLNESNDVEDVNLIPSESALSEEESTALQEEREKYFIERSKRNMEEEDDTFAGHLTKKMHEDPTVNLPLEKTLETAQFDQSRIIEPQIGGTALTAALQEFVPSSEIMGKDPGWILNSEQFFDFERSANVLVDVELEDEIFFPPNLHVHSYERGNVEEYDAPRMGEVRTIDFQEIELSSLLPVLALGVEPRDKVLDMCTETTDHSLMILQTLYPESINMNIHSAVRLSDVHRTMNLNFRNVDYVKYSVSRALPRTVTGEFNKILLSVPNIDDRNCLHSAHTYFNPMLSKDRLLLPEEQTEHIIEAMQLVQQGGTVVYSTATLSPLQNEGVIRSAVGRLRHEYGIEVKVKDLTKALRPLDCFFKFAPREVVSLGHLAVPFLPLNCGPRYICKLVKVATTDDEPCDAER